MVRKIPIDWRVIVAGLAALTIIECVALFKGINGVALASTVGIIGLTIGVAIPAHLVTKK